jgi:molecular chaperone Hsp33
MDGFLRGYARVDDRLDLPTDLSETPDLIGKRHLALTVDQGLDKERYQGIVGLEGRALATCALGYFAQSEQIPTRS